MPWNTSWSNEAPGAQMEIDVPWRLLRRVLAIVGGVCLVALLVVVGRAVSPSANGRPLVLTPERQAIARYLRQAENWTTRLESLEEQLDTLSPEDVQATPTGSLPISTPPAAAPGDLYERAHQAQAGLDAVTALAVEVERASVPAPLVGLHSLVTTAVTAHADWANALLAYTGAPDAGQAKDLTGLRRAAVNALDELRGALDG